MANPENNTVHLNGTPTTLSDKRPNQTSIDVWFWIIFGAIGVVALFGNSVVIVLIATRRRLQTACNSFILSLSLSDLLAAVTTIPGSFICEFGLYCNGPVFWIFCDFFICASVGNVCTLAVDRFCRVVYPLRYPVVMSSRRIAMLIMLGWTLPIFLQFIPSLCIRLLPTVDKWIFNVIQMFTFAILPCVGLLLAFAKITRITFKHSHHQRVQVAQIHRNSTTSQLHAAKRIPRKSFSVLVLGVVIFFFVLCWSFTIYRGICDSFSLCKVQLSVVLASRIFLVGNTAADPVVYAILKQDIRRELVRAFRSLTRGHIIGQDIHFTETRTAAGKSNFF